MSQGRHRSKADILQGTLDLMVLKTLAAMGRGGERCSAP